MSFRSKKKLDFSEVHKAVYLQGKRSSQYGDISVNVHYVHAYHGSWFR